MRVSASQTNQQSASLATRQDIDGVPHLVVPTVALVPGVLKGVLYRESDMKDFAATWNGIPCPVRHPAEDERGFSTANTIACEETVNIGKFYDAKWEDGKLKGNIYLNIEKAEAKGFGDIVANFEEGKMMEVSTSMSFEANNQSGTLDGKQYSCIALGIRPDHLALLPDEKGACSLDKGCGAMRLNEQEGEDPMKTKNDEKGSATNNDEDGACCENCAETDKIVSLRGKLFNAAKDLGVKIGLITNAETSHQEIRSMLQLLLEGKRTSKDDPWAWIQDVFDNTFVYEMDGKLLEQSYIEKDGVAELVGDPTEVVRVLEYKPKSGGSGEAAPALNVDSNKGDNPMKKDEMIAALIASDSSKMTAANKEAMEALDDSVLADMVDMAANADKAKADLADAKSDGAANAMSDDDRALFATLRDRENTRVAELRTAVGAANSHLTEEQIAGFPVDVLEAMAANIEKPTDFSGAGGAATGAKNDDGSKYVKPAVMLASVNGEQTGKIENQGEAA